MLTEETAKLLIEAANRLVAAIERATGTSTLGGGIHIGPTGSYTPQQLYQPPVWAQIWCDNAQIASLTGLTGCFVAGSDGTWQKQN
jgi:hypothetical protein